MFDFVMLISFAMVFPFALDGAVNVIARMRK